MQIVPPLNPALKGFQSAITGWALRRGRAAVFAGTGLGKSFMQLEWARVVAEEFGNVLILCPLAVAEQTVAEAQKFGIKGVAYAADQSAITTDITVTNYERSSRFDIERFAGIVLDECFAGDTLIDAFRDGMPCRLAIKEVVCGDVILNAAGHDTVRAVARREVHAAVRVVIEGTVHYCSPNHPWFTSVGWIASRNLRTGDNILATREAMRMVREGICSDPRASIQTTFLRNELLSELVNELPRTQGENAQSRSFDKKKRGDFFGTKGPTVSLSSRREWNRTDQIPETPLGTPSGRMASGSARCTPRGKRSLLQTGSCVQDDANRDRTGRQFAHLADRARQNEGREASFARVDDIEILESGHPELDRLRDANGKLYFYDLEGTRHPSFSVDGNLVHNSGIIKSHDGKTRKLLTESCRNVPWKLCCTATPAPNDYTELGQHSEFLGVMDAKEMLAMFFVHDSSIRAGDATQGNDGWRMKRHAAADFWRWLASWSVMVRHPRDLGFDEPGYDLPPLNLHQVTVKAEYKPTAGELFPMMASTLSQRIGVRRDTAGERVQHAANIIDNDVERSNISTSFTARWIVWCQLDKEQHSLAKILKDRCFSIYGSQPHDEKVSLMRRWLSGERPILVSKPKIFGYGMNLQCCSQMIFVGASDSFEQVYQAIRRCWRFGQTRPVEVYFIASELEGAVVANLKRKEQAFDLMLDAMSIHMRDLQRENVLGGRNASEIIAPRKVMEIPEWIR